MDNREIEETDLRNEISPTSPGVLRQLKACIHSGFPECLNKALTGMFGESGVPLVRSVIEKDLVRIRPISTPKELSALYDLYIKGWTAYLGKNETWVIEYETLKQIRSMMCEQCPLYRIILQDGSRQNLTFLQS